MERRAWKAFQNLVDVGTHSLIFNSTEIGRTLDTLLPLCTHFCKPHWGACVELKAHKYLVNMMLSVPDHISLVHFV